MEVDKMCFPKRKWIRCFIIWILFLLLFFSENKGLLKRRAFVLPKLWGSSPLEGAVAGSGPESQRPALWRTLLGPGRIQRPGGGLFDGTCWGEWGGVGSGVRWGGGVKTRGLVKVSKGQF